MSTRRYFLKRAAAVPLVFSMRSMWTSPDFLQKEIIPGAQSRHRIIIETDAGGDPDDEQSLVRFLLYSSEFDIEGIIANRPVARDPENKNPVRDGLGIVRAMINAYGVCYPNLSKHNKNFPPPERLLEVTVPGYDNTEDGVNLIIDAVDKDDSRPLWFCNWGTDRGSAESCLLRALTRVLEERGKEAYAKFKNRIRLSSSDKFGSHTTSVDPPFPLWIDTFRPPVDNKRWYHRFSALTANAGGFDINRDVREGHGPLGEMYPLNTSHPQKEGDTMTFLCMLPHGLSNPYEPGWGSWGGRYGLNEELPGKNYYWANLSDNWMGQVNRDNTLARWAEAFQNDFRVRMDWCVKPYPKANHHPVPIVNGDYSTEFIWITARPGEKVSLDGRKSYDPGNRRLSAEWFVYSEAGTCTKEVTLSSSNGFKTRLVVPEASESETIHIIFRLKNDGDPPLESYRRIIIRIEQ